MGQVTTELKVGPTVKQQREMLELAINRYAMQSTDKSTQNGAVVFGYGYSTGKIVGDCNRFPYLFRDTEERWERPQKYMHVGHAEHNALMQAARAGMLQGGNLTALAAPWAACDRCAVTIIESGIRFLVRIPYHSPSHNRWDDSIVVGDSMMKECGITIIEYTGELTTNQPLLRNGEFWTPGEDA
jgi:dCMP deaminase